MLQQQVNTLFADRIVHVAQDIHAVMQVTSPIGYDQDINISSTFLVVGSGSIKKYGGIRHVLLYSRSDRLSFMSAQTHRTENSLWPTKVAATTR